MKEHGGYTLVEVAVTLAILAVMAGLSIYAGVSLFTSSQIAKGVAQVISPLTFTRELAISNYNQWRIRLIPGSGSVATEYAVDYCTSSLPPRDLGSPVAPCTAWQAKDADPTQLDHVGILALGPQNQLVTQLVFDRTGRLFIPDSTGNYQKWDVTMQICIVNLAGVCTPQVRTVNVAGQTGMISVQ